MFVWETKHTRLSSEGGMNFCYLFNDRVGHLSIPPNLTCLTFFFATHDKCTLRRNVTTLCAPTFLTRESAHIYKAVISGVREFFFISSCDRNDLFDLSRRTTAEEVCKGVLNCLCERPTNCCRYNRGRKKRARFVCDFKGRRGGR